MPANEADRALENVPQSLFFPALLYYFAGYDSSGGSNHITKIALTICTQ